MDEDCVPEPDPPEEDETTDTGESPPDDGEVIEPDTGGPQLDTGASEPDEAADQPSPDTGGQSDDPNAGWEPPPSGVVSSSAEINRDRKAGCGCSAAPSRAGWALLLVPLVAMIRRARREIT